MVILKDPKKIIAQLFIALIVEIKTKDVFRREITDKSLQEDLPHKEGQKSALSSTEPAKTSYCNVGVLSIDRRVPNHSTVRNSTFNFKCKRFTKYCDAISTVVSPQ